MRKGLMLILVLLLAVVPLAAQDTDHAFIRAAHFSPDAGAVDIWVDGERVVEGMEFGAISDWLEVDAGTVSLAVAPEGAEAADAVLNDTVDLSAGDWATAVAYGEVAFETLALQTLAEDLTSIPEGLSRVGMLHAASRVDLVTVTDDTGRDLVVGLGYPGTFEGSDGYSAEDILAGEYTLTMTGEDGSTIAEVGPTTLGDGRYYLFAVIGTPENLTYVFDVTDTAAVMGGEEEMVTEEDTGTGPLMARIGHFAPDVAEVDVYLDGTVVAEGLGYTDVTDYMEASGGIHELALVPAGEALDAAVFSGEVALFEDSVSLVAVLGFAEDETLSVVAAQEESDGADTGEARVAFFQAIRSDALFSLSANDVVLAQGVAFPGAFEGAGDGYVAADIVAGSYEFDYAAPDAEIDVAVGSVEVGAGRYYLIVAVGTASAPNFVLVATDIPE